MERTRPQAATAGSRTWGFAGDQEPLGLERQSPGMGPTTQTSMRAPILEPDAMLASADPTAPKLILTAAKPKHKAPPKKRPAAKNASSRHPAAPSRPFAISRRSYTGPISRRTCEFLKETTSSRRPTTCTWTGFRSRRIRRRRSRPAAPPPKSPRHASSQASTHPAASSHRRRSSSSPTSQGATTEPAPKPVTVKWTGKLRVVPLDIQPEPSMVPGKAIVHLIGAPATLTRDAMHAQCGEAIFNSADNSASLLPSKKVPQVTMTGERGMKVDHAAGSIRRASRPPAYGNADRGEHAPICPLKATIQRITTSCTRAGRNNARCSSPAMLETRCFKRPSWKAMSKSSHPKMGLTSDDASAELRSDAADHSSLNHAADDRNDGPPNNPRDNHHDGEIDDAADHATLPIWSRHRCEKSWRPAMPIAR